MAVRPVLEIGHPVLSRPAKPVDVDQIPSARVQSWIDDLIDTMRDRNGAGIAANQVGIEYRLFVVEVLDNPRYPYKPTIPLTILVNPEIRFLSDKMFTNNEGCLSVPNLRGDVSRHLEVEMSGYDRNGKHHAFEVKGYSAGTFQHEFDHLDGVLFPHRVTDPRTFSTWDVFKEYRQAEFTAQVESLVKTWGS
jgi:peptide deformylase